MPTTTVALDRPAYLSLDRSRVFRACVARGMDRYGIHFAGSRVASYCPGVYEEAERFLAEAIGTQDAVIVSSGSLAAKLATEAISELGYRIRVSLPGTGGNGSTHPAWPRQENRSGKSPTKYAGLRMSVDPLTLRQGRAPGVDACEIDVVDASHDLFLHVGHALLSGAPTQAQLLVASLGKSLSIPAGIIAGPLDFTRSVRALATFRGASPPPPAYVSAVVQGWGEVNGAQARLAAVVERCHRAAHRRVEAQQLSLLSGYPVMIVRDVAFGRRLAQSGFATSKIAYPTATGRPTERIVLRAGLSEVELERLVALLR